LGTDVNPVNANVTINARQTLTPINTQTGLRARSGEIGTGADSTVGLIGCTRVSLPFSA
jgi:hypothetical protein